MSLTDGRKLLETARRHTMVAIVLGGCVPGLLWQRWKRDPDLGRVPVVVLSRGRPRQPCALGPFVRADAYVSAADLERRGAAADAVRTLISRGAHVPPTSRERFGETLWNVGSVLDIVGVVVAIGGAALTLILGSGGSGIMWGMPVIGAGKVLLDVGERLALGQRLWLRWQSWAWIVFSVIVVRTMLLVYRR